MSDSGSRPEGRDVKQARGEARQSGAAGNRPTNSGANVLRSVAEAIALADGFENADASVLVGFKSMPVWQSRLPHARAAIAAYLASGIETEGHDPEEGRGAKHESPAPQGDAQPKGYSGSVKL